jgi:hypothetical protein
MSLVSSGVGAVAVDDERTTTSPTVSASNGSSSSSSSTQPVSVISLHRQWDWWFDGAVPRGATAQQYEKSVKHLGTFASVQVRRVNFQCFFAFLNQFTVPKFRTRLAVFFEKSFFFFFFFPHFSFFFPFSLYSQDFWRYWNNFDTTKFPDFLQFAPFQKGRQAEMGGPREPARRQVHGQREQVEQRSRLSRARSRRHRRGVSALRRRLRSRPLCAPAHGRARHLESSRRRRTRDAVDSRRARSSLSRRRSNQLRLCTIPARASRRSSSRRREAPRPRPPPQPPPPPPPRLSTANTPVRQIGRSPVNVPLAASSPPPGHDIAHRRSISYSGPSRRSRKRSTDITRLLGDEEPTAPMSRFSSACSATPTSPRPPVRWRPTVAPRTPSPPTQGGSLEIFEPDELGVDSDSDDALQIPASRRDRLADTDSRFKWQRFHEQNNWRRNDSSSSSQVRKRLDKRVAGGACNDNDDDDNDASNDIKRVEQRFVINNNDNDNSNQQQRRQRSVATVSGSTNGGNNNVEHDTWMQRRRPHRCKCRCM